MERQSNRKEISRLPRPIHIHTFPPPPPTDIFRIRRSPRPCIVASGGMFDFDDICPTKFAQNRMYPLVADAPPRLTFKVREIIKKKKHRKKRKQKAFSETSHIGVRLGWDAKHQTPSPSPSHSPHNRGARGGRTVPMLVDEFFPEIDTQNKRK